MNLKICNIIFLFISLSLIFNNIPKSIQINFIGSILGNKLTFYPVIVGFVYTLYCQYKYKNVLVDLDKFFKFIALYFVITLISLLVGLYNYPYYNLIVNGSVTQIEKLPKVLEFLNGFGIDIDVKMLTVLWMIARTIKGLLLEVVYTFGGAYMIYCWYHDDWKIGINIFIKGILAGLIVVLGYGFIEIFYLAGSDIAKNILSVLNPYIHVIKVSHNWWPPLLWEKQARSVFPEPSHFGNYLAFALPVLWYLIINIKPFDKFNKNILLVLTFLFTVLIFLAQARTASAMLFGMMFLYVLLLLYLSKKDYWKNFSKIVVVSLIAFVISLTFINNFVNKPVSKANISSTKMEVKSGNKNDSKVKFEQQKTIKEEIKKIDKVKDNIKIENNKNVINKNQIAGMINNYVDNNLFSLLESNKRSNGARYALIKSNLRIGANHFWLGVGKGLTGAYISDNFTYEEKQNKEVNMWVTNQKKDGVLRYGLGAMNEYVGRFAETGIIGLAIFLFPFIYVVLELLKKLKSSRDDEQVKILMLLTSLIGVMVAGMNGSLDVFYGTWIILGLCYAALLCKNENKEIGIKINNE